MKKIIYLSITYNLYDDYVYQIYCTEDKYVNNLLDKNKTIIFNHICFNKLSFEILSIKNDVDITINSLKNQGLLLTCKNTKEYNKYKKYFLN